MQLKKSPIREDILRMEFLAEEIKIKVKILKDLPDVTFLTERLKFSKKNCDKLISIWIAISLKKLKFVKILKPEWLHESWLIKKINKENMKETLQAVPYNYVELTFILYNKAKEIFDYPDTILNLVETLFQIRLSKIWKGIKNIKKNIKIIQLNNIASVELYSVKNIILLLFQILSCFVL